MPLYILPARETFSSGFCRGLAQGINDWAQRRANQQAHEEQVTTQVLAQQRLMDLAHQQRLQEMAFQQQIESQKRTVVHHEKIIHSTSEIGAMSGTVILFSIVAILFIATLATLNTFNTSQK